MKYFIQIRSNTFAISKLLASAVMKHDLNNSKIETQDKKQTFILADSHLKLFQIIQTSSLTHFYIKTSNKRFRINKILFKFLNSLKKNTKINNRKTLDQMKPLFK